MGISPFMIDWQMNFRMPIFYFFSLDVFFAVSFFMLIIIRDILLRKIILTSHSAERRSFCEKIIGK